ncbi:hypothetical protein BX666DRAFT_1980480 [Dichotomocladium elegans]|nr:hypothetical protein BX666DRAFT_1980480 [Dichotomocladium elegans]
MGPTKQRHLWAIFTCCVHRLFFPRCMTGQSVVFPSTITFASPLKSAREEITSLRLFHAIIHFGAVHLSRDLMISIWSHTG